MHYVRLFKERHSQNSLSKDSMSQVEEEIRLNETVINVMVTGNLC